MPASPSPDHDPAAPLPGLEAGDEPVDDGDRVSPGDEDAVTPESADPAAVERLRSG